MNLRTYLSINDLKMIDFAKKIDVTPGYLSSILNGAQKPSRHLVKRIIENTNGQVTKEEILCPIRKKREKIN